MSQILKSLEERQQKIEVAKSYLTQTQKLFDEFGSQELRTSHAKFDQLLDALNSDAVRLVVLGEFTRGKSSLINALLGIQLLPTALEATTAINTFLKALPEGHTKRFIRIHYQDNRPVQDIDWDNDGALERWGTELDETHASVRKTLDYIEAFMDHPLLKKGLVIIDTPGLQSVMAHHEAITRKAIAEAHIALFVQNTSQLGGSSSEWEFMSDSIRNNFKKFITVVNAWDKVLDPDDSRDQRTPLKIRIDNKLEMVKKNFRKYVQDSVEVGVLCDEDHLIPVSALWAKSKDPNQVAQSGIDKLSNRIAEMFSSDEAVEQIYNKPLQQMLHIQQQLGEQLSDELSLLKSDKSIEERRRELESFEKDIQILKKDAEGVERESKMEHDRAAKQLVEQVRQELVNPLADLKAEIENEVDIYYIRRQIEKRVKAVGLPDGLHQKFQSISNQVAQAWTQQKEKLQKILQGLSVDYSQQMDKYTGQLRLEMSKLNVELPGLDIQFNLDFSDIEKHHKQTMQLQQEIEARQEQIDDIETETIKYTANQAQLDLARQAVTRAERMMEQLGTQPSAVTSYRREVVSEGGMYSSDKYGDVPYTDNSNVKAWQSERDSLKKTLDDKETRMAQIIEEEQRKTGMRMSLEKAQKKYERELSEFEKKKALYEKEAQTSQDNLIQETKQKLVKNTAGQLDQRIRYLQDHVATAIEKLFADQFEALRNCVQEQYLEPLKAKLTKREEIQTLLQQGEAQIAQRKQRLQAAQKELGDLEFMTRNALQA